MTAVNHQVRTVSVAARASPAARERRAQHKEHLHCALEVDLYSALSRYFQPVRDTIIDHLRVDQIQRTIGPKWSVTKYYQFCIIRQFRCRFASSLHALLFILIIQKWRKVLFQCASPRSSAHFCALEPVWVTPASMYCCQQVALGGWSNF